MGWRCCRRARTWWWHQGREWRNDAIPGKVGGCGRWLAKTMTLVQGFWPCEGHHSRCIHDKNAHVDLNDLNQKIRFWYVSVRCSFCRLRGIVPTCSNSSKIFSNRFNLQGIGSSFRKWGRSWADRSGLVGTTVLWWDTMACCPSQGRYWVDWGRLSMVSVLCILACLGQNCNRQSVAIYGTRQEVEQVKLKSISHAFLFLQASGRNCNFALVTFSH